MLNNQEIKNPVLLKDFNEFYQWSITNGYEKDLTIDRINNNKGYSPENCRWVTQKVQSRNTRRLRSTNTTGYRGILIGKYSYSAQISINSKSLHIGSYKTKLEAAKAYDEYIDNHNLEHTKNF